MASSLPLFAHTSLSDPIAQARCDRRQRDRVDPDLVRDPTQTRDSGTTLPMTTELERCLLADDPEQIVLYLQSHAKPNISEKHYPLLIRAQLHDWIQQQASHAMHSSALHSHVLTMLEWAPSAGAAAASPDRPSATLAELVSMFRGASLCHDDRLQHDLELCLIELKRHLWLDRLVHHTPLTELDGWLRRLLPLAFPVATSESTTPAALEGLESVWFHQPSIEAVAAEEEVAGELQSLLESGAEHEAVVEYCTKYPVRNFVQQALQWLDAALDQWKTKHGVAATAAAAKPAAPAPSRSKQTAQARAKAASNAAAAATVSPASGHAASAAKPAGRARVAASSSSSAAVTSWRWDSLSINALEVESLLPPALYANYPLDNLSPDELEPSGNSSQGGSQEGGEESEAQRRARKELEQRKAALLKAIHQQTHPEVVAFLRRELVGVTAPAPTPRTKVPPRTSPVLYTSFSALMQTAPATPAKRVRTKKRAMNPTDETAASASPSVAAAEAGAAASSAAASPAAAAAAAAIPSPLPKRPRRIAAAAADAALSRAAAAPMDLGDDADADVAADADAADDEGAPEGSEESKEEPRTQAHEDTEEGARAATAKAQPTPYKPLTPAVGIKAFFKTAARPAASVAAPANKRTK